MTGPYGPNEYAASWLIGGAQIALGWGLLCMPEGPAARSSSIGLKAYRVLAACKAFA